MTNVLPDATKNALLNSAVSGGLITSGIALALHNAFPPSAGNETAGGSPAYARKTVAFTATAAAGAISPSSGLPAVFDVAAGATVRSIGVWSSATIGAGTLIASSPAGASARRAFSMDASDLAGDLLQSPAHGLAAGNSVLVWATIGAGLPTGLSEDTEYFVIATGLTTDAFKLSATLGGSAIDITAIGDGDVQKFTPEVFAGQGTYTASTFSVALPG